MRSYSVVGGVVCRPVGISEKIVNKKVNSDMEAKLKRALPRKVRVAKPVHNW